MVDPNLFTKFLTRSKEATNDPELLAKVKRRLLESRLEFLKEELDKTNSPTEASELNYIIQSLETRVKIMRDQIREEIQIELNK